MKKYGVAIPDEMAEYVEETKGSGRERSRRIRELIQLGMAAERVLVDNQWFPPDPDERADIVTTAMREYVEEEAR